MPKPCSIDFHLLFGLLIESTNLEGIALELVSRQLRLAAAALPLPRQQMDRGGSSSETQKDVLHKLYERGTDFVARHERTKTVQQSVEFLIQN